MSRKKSNFPGSTTVPSGATFDFVSGSVNYKITDADFYSELGVTGTIVQDGDPTGVPVLDVQGTVNNIRNLEYDSDSGVKASVSAQNGIYLELDAQTSGDGIAVLSDTNTIRRIKAGAGIGVTRSSDDIIVSVTSVPASKRGVVQLAANSTATTLSASTPTKVLGTWAKTEESLFTATTGGRLTYDGSDTINALVMCNLDVTKAGAGSDTYVFEIYKNGSATGFRTKFAADANWSTAIVGALQLTTNDYVELYVEDTTSGNDITVNDATFMVVG